MWCQNFKSSRLLLRSSLCLTTRGQTGQFFRLLFLFVLLSWFRTEGKPTGLVGGEGCISKHQTRLLLKEQTNSSSKKLVRQHCFCPRSPAQLRYELARLTGKDVNAIEVGFQEMRSPVCHFNGTSLYHSTYDGAQDAPAAAFQSDFYQSVRAVCSMRKSILLWRMHLHCTFMRHLKELAGEYAKAFTKKHLYQHFGQYRKDKSHDCGSHMAPDLSLKPKTWKEKLALIHSLEADLVRRRALVEAIPSVVVLQSLRHLVRRGDGLEDLVHLRGDEAGVKRHVESTEGPPRFPFIEPAMRRLPEKLPDLRHGTCAVVGNSGILKLFKHGRQIDDHELVIRVNQGPDGGPQTGMKDKSLRNHVGSRTDVRILNRKWTELYSTKHERLLRWDPSNTTYFVTRADTKYVAFLADRLASSAAPRQMLWMNQRIVNEGSSLLKAAREGIQEGCGVEFGGGTSPSSGFVALQTALHMCDRVDVYGFSIGNCVGECHKWENYHYFDKADVPDRELSWNHQSHSFSLEGAVLKAMHIMGVLCINPPPVGIGECGGRLDSVLSTDEKTAMLAKSPFAFLNTLLKNQTLLRELSLFSPKMQRTKRETSQRASGETHRPRKAHT